MWEVNYKIMQIINKNTEQEVCKQYYNKEIKEVECDMGKELKVTYSNGSFFTHEKVVDLEETDYGFWVETTNKLWRFDCREVN